MSVTFENWAPEKVEQMVKTKLMSRGADVGKFVETDARRRLYSIKNPDTKRDRNYRHYLAKFILTNKVVEENKAVQILVGMKVGKSGQMYHGFYIETGSSTAPAQPYLRRAVLQNRKEILGLLRD